MKAQTNDWELFEILAAHDQEIWNILDGFFKREIWDKNKIDKFFDGCSQMYMDKKENVQQRFKKTIVNRKAPQPRERARHRLKLIRIAVLNGIPVEEFNIDPKYVFPQNNLLFDKPVFLSIEGMDTSADIQKKYKKHIELLLDKPAKCLQLHDYLGRGKRDTPTDGLLNYFKTHEDIFEKIETRLQNSDMEYVRILGLHIKDETENNFDDVSKEILWQCSPALFSHICRCLVHEKIGDDRAIFSVTSTPSRTYQFAFMEHEGTFTIYEEHYRLDDEGNAYPSFMTMHTTEAHNHPSIYINEIEGHLNNEKDRFFIYDKTAKKRAYNDIVECFQLTIEKFKHKTQGRRKLKNVTNQKIKSYNDAFGFKRLSKNYIRRLI